MIFLTIALTIAATFVASDLIVRIMDDKVAQDIDRKITIKQVYLTHGEIGIKATKWAAYYDGIYHSTNTFSPETAYENCFKSIFMDRQADTLRKRYQRLSDRHVPLKIL